MSLDSPSLAALVAAGLTFLLTPLVRRYALARNLVDHPGPRRSHCRPVARGGGLALAGAVLVVTPWLGLPWQMTVVWMLSLAAVAGIGWIEDHRPVPVSWRLALQLGAALFTVFWLGPVEYLAVAGREVFLPWLWTPLAVIALIWLANLYNFMDGSDGLASVQGAVTSSLFGLVFFSQGQSSLGLLALAVAGASLGFLCWNRPPAAIFLGDSGSLALGWMVALLALAGALTGSISVWLSFVMTSVFVVDATATLIDRLVRGQRWYTAHRDHAYQRAITNGWSHGRVLMIYSLVNLGVVVPAVALIMFQPDRDLQVAAVVAVLLLAGWGMVRRTFAAEHQE